MSYKRANWHSGLTYQTTCYHCHVTIRYTDYDLGFRAWYPDGFVYCPRCRGPLRHNEMNAINPDGTPMNAQVVQQSMPQQYAQPVQQGPVMPQQPVQQPIQQPVQQPVQQPAGNTCYCPKCGAAYIRGDGRFCGSCGNKLEN